MGKVTSVEAELSAIATGIELACQETCKRIVVFTDSIAQAMKSIDPSTHSGQHDSLRTCRAMRRWYGADPDRRIDFVWTPSRMRWQIHKQVHDYLHEMPRVPGRELKQSTRLLRQVNEQAVEDKWRTSSASLEYRGRGFLDLLTVAPSRDDRPVGTVQPNSSKGGSFMRRLRYESNSLVARLTRCITNHAPIGTYCYVSKYCLPDMELGLSLWSCAPTCLVRVFHNLQMTS